MVLGGVVHQLPKVGPHGGLATADVDVEDLHPLELVDHRLALVGGQLVWITTAGAGQAVHTGQVAGVGQLPGQADRCVQAALEDVHQSPCRRGRGSGMIADQAHEPSRGRIIPDSASRSRARS